MSRESQLEAALEQLLEMVERPPERNCSCHISPPCGDCVDWSGLRTAIADAESALSSTTTDPVYPEGCKSTADY